MAINVDSVAGQVLDAFKSILGQLAGDEAKAAQAQALALAQVLATVEAEHAAGALNDAQAQDLLEGARDDADAGLQGDAGIAELAAHSALTAGLKVLESVALGATGLGWLQPILDNVIADVGLGV